MEKGNKKEYLISARENEDKADKKLKGSGLANLFSSKGNRQDEARQLYEKAANSYKLAENWKKAGEMYEKGAEGDQHTYGSPTLYLLDAVTCYKKVGSHEFLNIAEKTINLLAEEGKLGQAARLRKEVAEKFEAENETQAAIIEYEKAAKLYEMDESVSYTNQGNLKAADLMAMLKEYDFERVINLYEKVAAEYIK